MTKPEQPATPMTAKQKQQYATFFVGLALFGGVWWVASGVDDADRAFAAEKAARAEAVDRQIEAAVEQVRLEQMAE